MTEKLSIVVSGLSPSDVLRMERETVRKWLFDNPPFSGVSRARVLLTSASPGQVPQTLDDPAAGDVTVRDWDDDFSLEELPSTVEGEDEKVTRQRLLTELPNIDLGDDPWESLVQFISSGTPGRVIIKSAVPPWQAERLISTDSNAADQKNEEDPETCPSSHRRSLWKRGKKAVKKRLFDKLPFSGESTARDSLELAPVSPGHAPRTSGEPAPGGLGHWDDGFTLEELPTIDWDDSASDDSWESYLQQFVVTPEPSQSSRQGSLWKRGKRAVGRRFRSFSRRVSHISSQFASSTQMFFSSSVYGFIFVYYDI